MSAETQKLESSPGTPPFIATAPALEVLAQLGRGLGTRKPIVVLSGEPGTGKSTLAQEAVRRMASRVTARTLAATDARPDTLLATTLARFGGSPRSEASPMALTERLMDALANATVAGKVALLVVEDAHALEPEVLLQLTRLSETASRRQCPLEVLLVGSPALTAKLAEPALASVAAQISLRLALEPLSQTDTRHYLLQRPGVEGANPSGLFSRKACRDIHTATLGVPRAIEALADEAQRRATRAGATTVSPEHVRAAAQALRARRGAMPPTVIASRAERLAGAAAARDTVATPINATPSPAPARQAAPALASPRLAAAAPTPTNSGDEAFPSSTDPRVKDWVSRFGGSGVGIGIRHAQASLQTFTDLDSMNESILRPNAKGGAATTAVERVAASGAVKPAASSSELDALPLPAPAPTRIPFSSMRRRQRDTTWQWAAAVIVVAGLAVAVGQRTGIGRRASFGATDTKPSPVADSLASSPRPASEKGVQPRLPAPKRQSRSTPPTSSRSTTPLPGRTNAPSFDPSAPPIPARPTTPVVSYGVGERYGVVVGAFLNRDTALAEKDHLARLTNYRVWVTSQRVEGVRTFRLMVGRFMSTDAAETAAQSLMRRGLIRDASVTPLPNEDIP